MKAQNSVYHWAAAALVQKEAGIAPSELASVQDPGVRAMQEKMDVVAETGLARDQARAVATLKDGRKVEVFIEHATGSAAKPMTDALLEAKFRSLARRVLDAGRTQALFDACRNLAQSNDPLELFRLGALQ